MTVCYAIVSVSHVGLSSAPDALPSIISLLFVCSLGLAQQALIARHRH